jgi:predicted glycoside hydrolase/deacetylase ChbG (UPF0249 family)
LNNNVRVSSHINIFENKPITSKDNLVDILDQNGCFKESFVFYMLAYYFGSSAKKKRIKSQISIEVESQLITLAKELGSFARIESIDSHNHIHMIPYIFDIFAELCKKHNIQNIRTVHEKFYFDFSKTHLFHFNFYIGVIKNTLLNLFTLINNKSVKRNSLKTNKYFIGVLFSGRMSKESIVKPLIKIEKILEDSEYVEVVLHPGITKESEYKYWENSPLLAKFYTSNNRVEENAILRGNNSEFY